MEPLYQQAQMVELKVQLKKMVVQKEELAVEKILETPVHKHQVDSRYPQNVVNCPLFEQALAGAHEQALEQAHEKTHEVEKKK